jgi:hypothetical protein
MSITAQRLDQLFPLYRTPPPVRTFKLSLVLGDTVSAGAYTAGALDMLLEALEAWNAKPDRPHQVVVVVKIAALGSGGSV